MINPNSIIPGVTPDETPTTQPQAARLAEIEARLKAAKITITPGVKDGQTGLQITCNGEAFRDFCLFAPADLRYLLDLVAAQAQEIAEWRKETARLLNIITNHLHPPCNKAATLTKAVDWTPEEGGKA